MLAESRNRVLHIFDQERVAAGDVVAAVESDVALAIAVLRLANRLEGKTRGRVEDVVKAVELLSPEAVQSLASRARTYDFFERSTVWDSAPERFRLHAVAVQRAAGRIAQETEYAHRDRLMVTSLLHDVGKLVLIHAYPGYPEPDPRRCPHTRGAPPARAPRARCRPCARRRRAHPPLGPREVDRVGDRAPPRGRRAGRGRHHPPRRHAGPLRARLADLTGRAAEVGPPGRPRPRRAARRHVRPALPPDRPHTPDRPVPALRPRARGAAAAWPRATSTSRSPFN